MTKRITVDGLDITVQVGAMYDALLNSMDWGSNFLDDETIDALLLIGELCGFEMGSPSSRMLLQSGFSEESPKQPAWSPSQTPEQLAEWERFQAAHRAWAARRVEHWRSQQRARLAARIAEMRGTL